MLGDAKRRMARARATSEAMDALDGFGEFARQIRRLRWMNRIALVLNVLLIAGNIFVWGRILGWWLPI